MLSQLFSGNVALVAVTLVGMAVCSVGIGRVAAQGAWLHPLSMLAYVIGALILAVVVAALMGRPLPLVDSTRAAIIAVVVLAVAKVLLTQLHRVLA